MATLERQIGAPLLIRPGGPRRVRLTPVGESLVIHARAVVARLHAAQADIAALLAGEHGRLHVAVMQSVGTQVLPALLRRFREEWPGVEMVAEEAWEYSELALGVESGRFDLSFAPLPVPDGPFAVRRVLDDPFVCLAPAGAPEVESGTVSLRQAARLPLIGFTDPDLHEELVRRLRRTGHDPTFVFRSNDNPTIQGFVAAGLGYALMPRLTVDEDDPHTAVVPLSSAVPPRQLGVVWHVDRQLTPAATRFVELAVEVCAELSHRVGRKRLRRLTAPRRTCRGRGTRPVGAGPPAPPPAGSGPPSPGPAGRL